MKKLLIILTIVLLTGCMPQFGVVGGLVLQGPDEFQKDITEGLDLLRDKAPEYYDLVIENVRKVWLNKDGDYNGVYDDNSYSMTGEAYKNCQEQEALTTYYIALTLVHEAVHLNRIKKGVDPGVEADKAKEEWFAVETEKVVAELIDAPQEIKDWLETVYASKYWENE